MSLYSIRVPTPTGLKEIHTTKDWDEAKQMAETTNGVVGYYSKGFGQYVHWEPKANAHLEQSGD